MIRETVAEDWQLLRDVRLRALEEAPYAFLETHEHARGFPEAHWRERAGSGPDGITFVHERAGRFDAMVSGFAGSDPGTVFLVAMWVAPELRGTGIARELVERVVGWASQRGAERVCLAVEPENRRAARLYEQCGFVRPAERPPFPWETDSPAYELRL